MVRDVTIGSHTPSGRVGTVTITTERGNFVVRGNDIRFVLRAARWRDSQQHLFFRRIDAGDRRRARASHAARQSATGMASACASGARSAARAPARTFARFSARTIRARRVGPGARSARRARRSLLRVCALRAATSRAGADSSSGSTRQAAARLARASARHASFRRRSMPTTIYAIAADYGEIAPQLARRLRRELLGVALSRRGRPDVRRLAEHGTSTEHGGARSSRRGSRSTTSRSAPKARYIAASRAAISSRSWASASRRTSINAEGKLINGTFVERSLDNIALGIFVNGGRLACKLAQAFRRRGSARGDLLSGFRSTQVRAGATYYFGHIRGMQPRAVRRPSRPP